MLYRDRATVCVSSQAGCAMGCGFCATGQSGFDRHLTTGEIVEQVVVASRRARVAGHRLSNVVFMGMGEPLANEAAVWAATQRIHDDLGLSARHITLSTVGVVPGIRRPRRPPPAGHAGREHPRRQRCAARRARAAQPPLPARRHRRRLPAVHRRHRPAGQLRVGDDRRGQRSAERCRRAGRPRPPAAPGSPRQPDPAQPDARLADDRFTGLTRPPVPRSARHPRRRRRPSAAIAAPTSTPPAASSPPATAR